MQADTGLVFSSPDWRETLKLFDHIENKIKLASEPYPNFKVLTVFANLAYSDCTGKLDLPKGWKLLTTARNNSRSNGYFGCAFWKPSEQQVVIAHRGTDPKCWGAILTDGMGVICNMNTSHMNSAISFAEDVKNAILKINEQSDSRFVLSFTGHSLGAWLAGVTTFTTKYLERNHGGFSRIANHGEGLHAHTLALDSPGVEDILIKISRNYSIRYNGSMCTKQLDITTYFSAPNLVNTFGYHVGDLHQFHAKFVPQPSSSGAFNMDAHGIGVFIKAFDDDDEKNTYDVLNWPHGKDELNDYHELKIFTNSYILRASPKSSNSSHEGTDLVEVNADSVYSGEEPIVQYSTVLSSGNICHLGIFSTKEFNFIQNWSLFQSNPQIERTKINDFTKKQNLKTLNLPIFKINTRSNTMTCHSKEDLRKVIGQTKQLLRWWEPEIMEALAQQNNSIKSAPLHISSLAYCHSLPNILDCEDTLELDPFLKSIDQHVLEIIVNSDFDFEAARLYSILTLMVNTSLKTKYLAENCYILSWNDIPKIAEFLRFEGIKESNVTSNRLLILNCPHLKVTNEHQIPPECDIMRTILSNLGLNTKLIIIRSHSIGEKLYHEYKLTVKTNFLKAFELSDLTPGSRKKILSRHVITIGEEELSLNTLLRIDDGKYTNEPLRNTINNLMSPILKSLAIDSHCIDKIPNKLPRLCELDAFYSKGYKQVDKAGLSALLRGTEADGPLLVISDPEQLNQDHWGEVSEAARGRIFTTGTDRQDLFLEKCREEPARTIYWFLLSTQGFSLNEVYNPSVYLPRKFHSRFIIESIDNFIQNSGGNDLYILNNVKDKMSLINQFALSEEAADLLNKNDHFKIRSQELNDGDQKQENPFSKHYFEVSVSRLPQSCLVWQYSEGFLDDLRPFIARDCTDPIKEEDFCIRKKKLTIIADDPGMGKTTILTRMSERIQDSWVLRIDHKLLDSATAKFPAKLDLQLVADCLLHASGLPTYTKFVSGLLQHCLKSNNSRQVCVFVDAFDEITEEQIKNHLVKLLKYLKTSSTCQIVITTRVYQQRRLENDLAEFAAELEKITSKEQEDYLVNFWLPHLALELPEYREREGRLHQFARDLQKEMEEVLGEDVASLMGIPLQIRMLAEVFLQQAILSVQSLKQIENSCKITNLFDLYKQFIEVKKTIYFEQKKDNIIKRLESLFQKDLLETIWENHYFLAFQINDPKFSTQYFTKKVLSYENMTDICSVGLVRLKLDGTFHFIHRTFQEYFCADFFVQWLRQSGKNKEENNLIKNVMSRFFLKPDYKMIRTFIEAQLETMPIPGEALENHPVMYQHWCENRQLFYRYNKTPLHIAAEEQNKRIVEVFLSGPSSRTSEEAYISFIAVRDKAGRTALNIVLEKRNSIIAREMIKNVGSCSYESLLKLMLATFLDTTDDVDEEINTFRDISENLHLTSVNRALTKIQQIRKKVFKPFIAAVRDDDYETVCKIFSDTNGDIERAYFLIAIDSKGDTAINLATCKEDHRLFKLFAKQGVSVSYDKVGRTPLHCAANQGYFSVVNFLLNQSEETYEPISNKCFENEKTLGNHSSTLKYENNNYINSQDMRANINSANNDCYSALLLAVRRGDDKVVDTLLKSGADPNYADKQGNAALILAVKGGYNEVVRSLLESKADPNSSDSQGNSVLILAVKEGYREVVSILLEYKADTNSADSLGYTALMLAVKQENHEMVRILLESKADPNSADSQGNSVLILAVKGGHHEMIPIMLEYRADTNSADSLGQTALMLAVERGYHEVVRKLLKSGTNPNSADIQGNSVLILAVKGGHHEMVPILLEYKADTNSADVQGNSVLILAVKGGHHEVVRMLLNSGSNPNSADSQGNSVLILAAKEGNHELVSILLEYKADTNSADVQGNSVLILAVKGGHHEVVRMLLNSGSNPNSADSQGNSVLILAAKEGNHEMVSILLEYKADTKSADSLGQTALMFGAERGYHEVVRRLLEAGSNPNSADGQGNSVLILAVKKGHHDVVRMLLDSRSNPNSADSQGNSVLILAVKGGHQDMVRRLLESGSNPNSSDSQGNSVLILAVKGKQYEMVSLLLKYNVNTNSADSQGHTALMLARERGYHEMVLMLQDCESNPNSPSIDSVGNIAESYTLHSK